MKYTVTSLFLDQDGYTVLGLMNSVGNYGGVVTDYPQADHYYQQAANCKVGDTISL
jgi:TPR repeat protein